MKWIGSPVAEIWPLAIRIFQDGGRRHLEFVQTGNGIIRSAECRPRKPYRRTKHEIDRMILCGDMAIRNTISWEVHLRPQFFREGEVVGGRRWYHWKERCWFPIGSSLWPLRYLWPFSHNVPSNVCDAQFDRGWVTLSQNFRVFPLEYIPDVGIFRERTPRAN